MMGFCDKEEQGRFLELCPGSKKKYITDGGILLLKYWPEVSDKEQKRRFEARITDPIRQWKLSPMDLPSRSRWYDYPAPGTKCSRLPTRIGHRGT